MLVFFNVQNGLQCKGWVHKHLAITIISVVSTSQSCTFFYMVRLKSFMNMNNQRALNNSLRQFFSILNRFIKLFSIVLFLPDIAPVFVYYTIPCFFKSRNHLCSQLSPQGTNIISMEDLLYFIFVKIYVSFYDFVLGFPY